MRISADFEDLESAVLAHQAVLKDAEVDPENIEIRSAWPLFEEPLPPHRHRPMRIRNIVRGLWVCGAIGGFSLASLAQLDYPIVTSGHPIVPIPLDAIITYECAQITALISTAIFFFIETKTFRMRPIPQEEDLAVANGAITLVIDGPKAEAAKGVLEKVGTAKVLRTFGTWMMTAVLLGIMFTQSGCVADKAYSTKYGGNGKPSVNPVVRMRRQIAIRDTEQPREVYPDGTYSMPWANDPDLVQLEEPYGRQVGPDQLAAWKKQTQGAPRVNTPPALMNVKNPFVMNSATENRAERLYKENCAFCHGVDGKGNGPVGNLYQPPPADLTGKNIVDATDGQLYWIMTVGPTTMPAFGNKMSPMDRFAIVQWVRRLQHPDGAPPTAGAPDPSKADAPPAPATTPAPASKAPNTKAPDTKAPESKTDTR